MRKGKSHAIPNQRVGNVIERKRSGAFIKFHDIIFNKNEQKKNFSSELHVGKMCYFYLSPVGFTEHQPFYSQIKDGFQLKKALLELIL